MRAEYYWTLGLLMAFLLYWAYDGAMYEKEMMEDHYYELSTQLRS